jgi:ATP-dependent protease HslVU (ClpYQ) peptidase subunit
MTTIVVVRKGGVAAIAADTLTKWGSAKESAEYVVNSEKILKVGSSHVAVTGNATFKMILRDYFLTNAKDIHFGNPIEIFRTWNHLHGVLKSQYFLMPEEDKEDAVESSRMDVLIANPHGIFGVAAHRTVQEFSKFYAYGSGSDYALGAMYSIYDKPNLGAAQIARMAIGAAAEFDDGTGLPAQSFAVKLRKG